MSRGTWTRLIQCFVIQGDTVQCAGGLGSGLRYSREGLVGYENVLAVNAEILDHVRQGIREHDGRNAVGRWPKTLRKRPMSALMNSYLK
jgi:hypothetical protein